MGTFSLSMVTALRLHLKNLQSGQLRDYRPRTRQWDAGWKIYNVVALARPKHGAVIYGNHFHDGPTPLSESPHFEFVEAHLAGHTGASENYIKYLMDQYRLSRQQALGRGDVFRRKIDGEGSGAFDHSVAARIVGRKVVIADGFHRASIALAKKAMWKVSLWMVGPGGRIKTNPSPDDFGPPVHPPGLEPGTH